MPELSSRRLYLCVAHREDMATFLPAVLRGGVDVVQLREKELPDTVRLATARLMAPICRDFGVPFIMNDSPELALESRADGVHVGQDDVSVDHCRDILGADAVVGLSTHSAAEFDDALSQAVSYFSAGPIVPTPTKLGRPGTGTSYAVACEERSDRPVFVTGGVSTDNIAQLVSVGLRHFVVVRAICDAPDPEAAAQTLRRALDLALESV
ncbi:MAG: thiamine phosphate synthase [Acidimicrobiales bacterium]